MLYKLPKLAYAILNEITDNKTMTQEEIASELDVDPDSVKYAIRRLQEHDLVQQIPDLLDMRKIHYRLPTYEELEEVKENLDVELFHKIVNYVETGDHSRSIGEKSHAIYKQDEDRLQQTRLSMNI